MSEGKTTFNEDGEDSSSSEEEELPKQVQNLSLSNGGANSLPPAPKSSSSLLTNPEAEEIPFTLTQLDNGLTHCVFHLPAKLCPLLLTNSISCNGCFFDLHLVTPESEQLLQKHSISLRKDNLVEEDSKLIDGLLSGGLYTQFQSPKPEFTARAIGARLKIRAMDPNGGAGAAAGCTVC